MPLPQEVINRLSEERPLEAGWSSGLFGFSIALFLLVVLLYGGIMFGYGPYLTKQTQAVNAQLTEVTKAVSTDKTTDLVQFYSQVSHVRALAQSHIYFSQFLTWLSSRTEANTYFTALEFAQENQISLTLLSRSEGDVNRQIALFESDPSVMAVNVSNISIASVSGYWQANITLTLDPKVFKAPAL